MIIPDVLESFINSLNYKLNIVDSVFDNVNNKTIFTYTKSILYLRPKLFINIDSNKIEVESVDYINKTITVSGNYSVFTNIELEKPNFIHGTTIATNSHLNKTKKTNYPLVYLLEIIKESIPSDLDSKFYSIPTLRLFFLDESNFKDWNTDQIYNNVISLQRDFCDFFIENVRKNGKTFGLPSNMEIVTLPKFGVYTTDKGVENSLFDKNLSGLELKLDLPIVKKCVC